MIGYFRMTINEDRWTFYVVDDEDNVIADEDEAAFVDIEKKEGYFRRGYISLVDVRHEIWHIYFKYTFTRTTSMSIADLEEVSAELFSDRGDRMVERAQELYEKLIKIRDSKVEIEEE